MWFCMLPWCPTLSTLQWYFCLDLQTGSWRIAISWCAQCKWSSISKRLYYLIQPLSFLGSPQNEEITISSNLWKLAGTLGRKAGSTEGNFVLRNYAEGFSHWEGLDFSNPSSRDQCHQKVNSLMGRSSSGSNSTLQRLCNTMEKSQEVKLLDFGALLRLMAVRNLLIKGLPY